MYIQRDRGGWARDSSCQERKWKHGVGQSAEIRREHDREGPDELRKR